MQKSTATKTTITPAQRLRALFGQTSFVVTLCAALALVLGAISVGASRYVSRPDPEPAVSAPAPVASQENHQASPPTVSQTTDQPQPVAEPVPPATPAPTSIGQPADITVPTKKPTVTFEKPGLLSIAVNTESSYLTATIHPPKAAGNQPLTIDIPRDGIPVISSPHNSLPRR